jgi:hypothetical protein
MLMKNLIIIIAISAFIFSCQKSTDYPTFENMDVTSNFILDNAIIISQGDCAGDAQSKIYICLDSVLNDSRCPQGVQCFWQGNAEARFKFVKSDDAPVFFNLNTYPGFTNDTIVGGYKFTLKAITPYPGGIEILKPKFYKAEILIEKENR